MEGGSTVAEPREPIAIVGIGCRMPGGANHPDAFWRLLCDGADGVCEVPPSRWHWPSFFDPEPGKTGKLYTRRGGFIDGVELFDAPFFNLSRREAERADPQQRLVLEVAYETLEDAGAPIEAMAGSRTGVYIGICTFDHAVMTGRPSERLGIDAYSSLGSALCVAANRLSYYFDLRGPSLAVDTACSSSLVAMHLACQSIWKQESDMALVGGVNVLLQPDGTVGFCQARMLAPDGRCKSFAAAADGYVRSEGVAIVLLKPLSRALRDQDRIYAVARGTGVNQDGRTPGITVPSETAQAELLKEVYRQCGIPPNAVQYLEAHGTGTAVGDPIEARALGRALSEGRDIANACLLGSVKSNIGHLEAASGIAGVLKAALAIHHDQLPANLHFDQPNPAIPFDELKLRVVREPSPWPEQPPGNGRARNERIAGVNSFGFGGTNAHVVLSSPPATQTPVRSVPDHQAMLVPLSARSPAALRALARSLASACADPGRSHHSPIALADVAHTMALRRSHFEYRAGIAAESLADFAERAQALGEDSADVDRISADRKRPLVFVFSGMGPQWWAMGRQLMAEEPVFGEALEACDRALRLFSPWSLIDELSKDEAGSRINETCVAQPGIFAIQVALCRLWESWGIRPDRLMGHSLGEVAAAHVAGVLDLPDAAALVHHRSRLQAQTAGEGRMLSVSLPVAEVEALTERFADRISIAAYNSPESVTLSGEAAALQLVADDLARREVFHRFLKVDVPYHSRAMDRLKVELLDSLRSLTPRPAAIPLVSTLTGEPVRGEEMTADYWWRSMRQPVRFTQAVETVTRDEDVVFLEIGPHPVLSASISESASASGRLVTVLPSLRRNERERATMLTTVGRLYALGMPIDWRRVNGDSGRFVSLPRYPWQHERYWHETEQGARMRFGKPLRPLLGSRADAARTTWVTDLNHVDLAFLNDHQVDQFIVFPAAGYLEMAVEAMADLTGRLGCVVEELAFDKAMMLPGEGRPIVQLSIGERGSDFEIHSRGRADGSPWERHASGRFRAIAGEAAPPRRLPADVRRRCPHSVAASDCYGQFALRGLRYGPAFRGIRQLWAGDGEAIAHIESSAVIGDEADGFIAHPGVVDAAFQALMGAVLGSAESNGVAGGMYLPARIGRVVCRGRVPARLWSHARLTRRPEHGGRTLVGDIDLLTDDGEVVLEIRAFACQRVDRLDAAGAGGLWQFRWVRDLAPGSPLACRADDLPSPGAIVAALRRMGGAGFWRGASRTASRDPQTRELALAYTFEAFARMGWRPPAGEQFSADDLAARLGVIPSQRQLFERILASLAEQRPLSRSGERWTVTELPVVRPSDQVWKSIWDQYPGDLAELTLLRRCGRGLDRVLRGEVTGLDLVFPGGSSATLEHLYQDSPTCRNCNRIVQKVVATVLEAQRGGQGVARRSDRVVRILEIGGGTGGMASHVLPELAGHRCCYVFTDVAALLLSQAEQRFGRNPQVEFRTLDIERNPLDQGFEAHSFDIILAADVLHATADLRATLGNVRRLLASQGLLIVLEGVLAPTPLWTTLIFGLLRDWWIFADGDLRGLDPWIAADRWRELLESCGFADTIDLTAALDADEPVHAVLAARGPDVAVTPRPTPQPAESVVGGWLIVAPTSTVLPSGRIADDLARRLRAAGQQAVVVSPDRADTLEGALRAGLDGNGPASLRGVVHLASLDSPSASATGRESWTSVLQLVQRLHESSPTGAPRLLLVTGGAEEVGGPGSSVPSAGHGTPEESPTGAILWGFGRVIINECPSLRCKLVDLDPADRDAEALYRELMLDDAEQEVANRGGVRFVHRYEAVALGELPPRDASGSEAAATSYAIEPPVGGSLERLTIRRAERVPPGSGQVEIAVHASGLNFKDVMLAMGLLPEDALEGGFTGRSLGMECAGVVTAVGSDVRDLHVGDRVMACGPGTLRSHLTLDTRYVAPIPEGMTFEAAATVLIAYLTAYYGLVDVARLQPGERVLIHAAAGGVGLAAVQLAQHLGAEIYATAGSDEKRDLLRSLGVRHVLNSRTLAFADEILDLTGGEGVDVVLNSLAGDAIPKSLAVLRPYGRFIEIGKRDVYEDSKVGLRPFRNNLSLSVLDLDRVCAQRPELARESFQQIVRLLNEGRVRPLPHRVFPVDRVQDAFRYMAQARHTGKVVVSLRTPPATVAAAPPPAVRFNADGSYLITGGLGGFGLRLAKWLVDRGARHVALVSRRASAPDDADTAAILESMRACGATVRIVQGDISVEDDVRRVLADVERWMPPLRGVFHAAMVIDDGPIVQLTADRFRRVLAPKVDGAWHLHRITAGRPLDHFVLFSSMACQVGNPGQANYAAANAYLEALARRRRAAGLPALAVHWGAIADAGYVARSTEISRRLEANGIRPEPVERMLDMLGVLMQRDAVQVGVGHLDWGRLASVLGLTKSPRFAHLVTQTDADAAVDADGFDLEAILRADPTERLELIRDRLRERLSRVLGTPAGRLDVNQSLVNLGMDSLMAVEMRNRIRGELGVDVPPTKFMEGITMHGLASFVLERLAELHAARFKGTAPASDRGRDPSAAEGGRLTEIDRLSDNEVKARLQELLADAKGP